MWWIILTYINIYAPWVATLFLSKITKLIFMHGWVDWVNYVTVCQRNYKQWSLKVSIINFRFSDSLCTRLCTLIIRFFCGPWSKSLSPDWFKTRPRPQEDEAVIDTYKKWSWDRQKLKCIQSSFWFSFYPTCTVYQICFICMEMILTGCWAT